MFGASNAAFEARTRGRIQVVPWVVPLVSSEPNDTWPDFMVRQTADLDRDMIILTPGKTFPVYIRVPEDSIVRLSDLKLIVAEAVTLTDPATGLPYKRYLTSVSTDEAAITTFGTQSDYYDQVMVSATDPGSGTPIFEGEVPASFFRGDVDRPRGKHSLLNRNMPPRGIIQLTLRHVGDTASLRVYGHIRGTRVRL